MNRACLHSVVFDDGELSDDPENARKVVHSLLETPPEGSERAKHRRPIIKAHDDVALRMFSVSYAHSFARHSR